MRSFFTTLLVITLFFAVSTSGILHSLIPHHHDHGSEAVWSDYHGALRHEDKKIIAFLSACVSLAIIPLALLVVPIPSIHVAAPIVDRPKELLRRGIPKYRRFG